MVRRLLASAAMAALFLCPNTSAQSVNARVSGWINDATGARLPGVTLTATNMETGVVTTTLSNETGMYSFPSLQPGLYKLSAGLSGFLTHTYENLQLGNDAYPFSFTLPLASVVTNVEVPAMTMDATMAASSQSAGSVLSGTMVRDLPLVGNDSFSFVRMLPGINSEIAGAMSPASMLSFAGVPQVSINTTRDGVNVSEYRYNTGAYASMLIHPDLVGEIRLILTPVDAALGRGNGQVQIQTRSGTNQYAGSVVWNIRNTALNANTWSNNATVDRLTGQWKPTEPNWYNHHEYAVSYGGPIRKNRTFFYALWEQQMQNGRNLVTGSVMTSTARQGIFRYFEGWNPGNALTVTNAATPIIASVDLAGNPVAPQTNPNGTPYTGSLRCFSVFGNVKFDGTPFAAADCPGGTAVVNPNPWDSLRPVADPTGYIRKILDRMPTANYFGSGDGLNVAGHRWVDHSGGSPQAAGVAAGVVFGSNTLDTDRKQIHIKIDESLNPSHRLSVGWSHERAGGDIQATPLWPGGLPYSTERYPHVFTASFTSALSPNVLNEARFGLRHQNAGSTAPWESEQYREEALRYALNGSNGYSANVSPGAGNYEFGGTLNGVMQAVPAFYGGSTGSLYTVADTLSWSFKRHALKFGVEIRLAQSNGYGIGPAFQYPRVVGGAGGFTSPLANTASLPSIQTTSRTNASNMSYFLAGSVNSASMGYWVDNPGNVSNGTWEDSFTKGRNHRNDHQNEWAAFWKDDWKISHNLTLNLGLRYEYYGSPFVASGATMTTVEQGDGLWGAFRTSGVNPFERWLSPGSVYLTGYGPNVSPESALRCMPPACDPNTLTRIELVGPNSPNPGKRLIAADRNNFGPAVGFAWRFPWFGAGNTTVRGGYQITYGGPFGETGVPTAGLGTVITNAPGWVSSASTDLAEFSGQYLDLRSIPLLVPVRPNPVQPGQPIPVYASSGNFVAFDARYVSPYVQNFSLSVTRTLRQDLSLDVRYIGTTSRKQSSRINLNTPNVYHNPELFEALEVTRAGGDSLLLDQMLAGLNLNSTLTGSGPVGTVVNGVPQTGSVHLRRNAAFAALLANGNFAEVARLLNGAGSNLPTVGTNGGFLSLPQGLTGVGGRLLRNGCDRLAAGQTIVGPNNPAPLRCFPENYIRANPQAENAFLNTNSASSNYHSMQAQIMWRPNGKFAYMGTYTWAKDLGVPGFSFSAPNQAEAPDYTDPSNRGGDYTYSAGHRAHDFRSSGTFEVPAGPGRLMLGNSSGWLARLVEGWRTSIILTMTSGARANIISTVGGFPTGLYGSSVPDDVGWPSDLNGEVEWNADNNPAGTLHGGTYFGPYSFIKITDPQCTAVTAANNLRNLCSLLAVRVQNPDGSAGPIVLQNPKPGTRGTLGQNRIELPGTWSFDASLAKTLMISESGLIKSLQLRVDATNVLNHPMPLTPNLNINGSIPFGFISTKGGERAFQGQVRVNF